jgi:hypothetical protein
MIRVKMPAEIKEYKEKLVFGLTVRQAASIGGALLAGVPIGVFGGRVMPADMVGWCVILAVAPIVAWGFATYSGMRFEVFARVFINYFATPQRRVYEDADENLLCKVNEVIRERRIKGWRAANGKRGGDPGDDEEGGGDEDALETE